LTIKNSIPGLEVLSTSTRDNTYKSSPQHCDYHIRDDVLVVSHEFVHNLGHFLIDVINWWLASELVGVSPQNLIMLNIDGLRPGGVIFGSGRFMQDPDIPDKLGPFQKMLQVMFREVIPAHERFGSNAIVCIDKAHFYPMPPRGWEKFEVEDRCSFEPKPSYVYQKFLLDYRRGWRSKGELLSHQRRIAEQYQLQLSSSEREMLRDTDSVTQGDRISNRYSVVRNMKEYIRRRSSRGRSTDSSSKEKEGGDVKKDRFLTRILFIVRSVNTSADTIARPDKPREHVTKHSFTASVEPTKRARYFSNLQEVLSTLYSIPHTQVITADFDNISVVDQVALSSSVDLLIGFHGAGITHMFHMDPLREKCCGVLELFPQSSGCHRHNRFVCVYHKRVGHGNMARHLGFRYSAYKAPNGSYSENGTKVETEKLKETVVAMIKTLSESPTQIISELLRKVE